MNPHDARSFQRAASRILLKTLVLDCSFGFIIQLGFGSYGTPAREPRRLITANHDALLASGTLPVLFRHLLLAASARVPADASTGEGPRR